MKTLNDLIKKGWISTNKYFADLEIYKRNDDRLLYDRKKDEIQLRYGFEE